MASKKRVDPFRDHRAEYAAHRAPLMVDVPRATYLTVEGKGAPAGGEFQAKAGAIYRAAYALKFDMKAKGRDFKLAPLEGLWWGSKIKDGDFATEPPEDWHWKLILRVPDFVGKGDLRSAIAALQRKGEADGAREVQVERLSEGKCVQALHVGPYRAEGQTLDRMMSLAAQMHLAFRGKHHEIYLSDPRRVAEARLRTILRHPVGSEGRARRATPRSGGNAPQEGC